MAATAAKSPAVKAVIEERRVRVLQMRQGGMSLRQIAKQLGVSLVTAKRDMDAVYDRLLKEQLASADQLRALELERLDQLMLSRWAQAIGKPNEKIAGNDKALVQVLAIMKQRSALLGLDAPTKLEHSFTEVDAFLKLLEDKRIPIPDVFQKLFQEFQHVNPR